jgi:hypothetical protein
MQQEELGEGRKQARVGLSTLDGGAAFTWTDSARLRDTQLPKRAVVSSVAKLESELNCCASASRIELRGTVTLSAKAETAAPLVHVQLAHVLSVV